MLRSDDDGTIVITASRLVLALGTEAEQRFSGVSFCQPVPVTQLATVWPAKREGR
jgi:hypothetical protein